MIVVVAVIVMVAVTLNSVVSGGVQHLTGAFKVDFNGANKSRSQFSRQLFWHASGADILIDKSVYRSFGSALS